MASRNNRFLRIAEHTEMDQDDTQSAVGSHPAPLSSSDSASSTLAAEQTNSDAPTNPKTQATTPDLSSNTGLFDDVGTRDASGNNDYNASYSQAVDQKVRRPLSADALLVGIDV
jgi:hypothetical protein